MYALLVVFLVMNHQYMVKNHLKFTILVASKETAVEVHAEEA